MPAHWSTQWNKNCYYHYSCLILGWRWWTHYIYLHSKIVSLWEELVKNSENTLEQIAEEGVDQNTLKQIGGSWSRVYQKIPRAIAIMCFLHSWQTPSTVFLTNSLHKLKPSSLSMHVTCSSPECNLIMEYSSTSYIGMAPQKNGCPIVCVQSDMFNTLP